MAKDKAGVAADLRRFVTFTQGLTDAADTLDQMQSLEESAKAAEARVKAAGAQMTQIQSDLDVAGAQLVAAQTAAAASLADAKVDAAAVIDKAKVKAAKLLDDAAARAEGAAAAVLASAHQQEAALSEQITAMGDQLIRMTDDSKALDETLAVGQVALTELEGKLAAAREAIGKLLG